MTFKSARKVSNFHHVPGQLELPKAKQEALNMPVHRLKMNVKTRRICTCDIIVPLLENEEPITAVLKVDKNIGILWS